MTGLGHSFLCLTTILLAIPQHCGSLPSSSGLFQVDNDNWNSILDGEWLVEFFDSRDRDPSYRNLQSVWEDFVSANKDLEIRIGQVDVFSNPALSNHLMMDAKDLPTILHVKDGVFRQYEGPRSKEGFLDFLHKKRWKDLEPISNRRRQSPPPSAFRMTLLQKVDDGLKIRITDMLEGSGLDIPAWVGSLIVAGVGFVIGVISGVALSQLLTRMDKEAAFIIVVLLLASALTSLDP